MEPSRISSAVSLVAGAAAAVFLAAAPAPAVAQDRYGEPVDLFVQRPGPSPRDNEALIEWRHRRPWRYDTRYLFGLTRGLPGTGIAPAWEPAAWVLTIPFDIANLPFAALAGLAGE